MFEGFWFMLYGTVRTLFAFRCSSGSTSIKAAVVSHVEMPELVMPLEGMWREELAGQSP